MSGFVNMFDDLEAHIFISAISSVDKISQNVFSFHGWDEPLSRKYDVDDGAVLYGVTFWREHCPRGFDM